MGAGGTVNQTDKENRCSHADDHSFFIAFNIIEKYCKVVEMEYFSTPQDIRIFTAYEYSSDAERGYLEISFVFNGD